MSHNEELARWYLERGTDIQHFGGGLWIFAVLIAPLVIPIPIFIGLGIWRWIKGGKMIRQGQRLNEEAGRDPNYGLRRRYCGRGSESLPMEEWEFARPNDRFAPAPYHPPLADSY